MTAYHTATPRGLILFDCDGTLTDSCGVIQTAMQAAFEAMGYTAPAGAAISALVGRSLHHVIAELLVQQQHTASEACVAQLAEHYRQQYHQREHNVSLFPGVSEGLLQLREQGYWLGVVTGKSRAGLERTLDDFDLREHFLCLRTADCCRSKPDPEMVESSLDELGMVADDTWVVGDSRYDMQMAVHAGVRAMGVSYSDESSARLQQAGAYCVADSFADVLRLLG